MILVWIFTYFIQHCFICRTSDSTVSEDAGIDPSGLWIIGHTHKTSVFKTSGFKTSETSGLQNVSFTKRQLYKTSGRQNVRSSKRPVAKKYPYNICTCGWWKSAGLKPDVLKPDVLLTWRFVNLTFSKPDVLKPDVLKPDVLKPDVLKPDVLWVYR